MFYGGLWVGVRRFELPTSTSRTWRANRATLHPEFSRKGTQVQYVGQGIKRKKPLLRGLFHL